MCCIKDNIKENKRKSYKINIFKIVFYLSKYFFKDKHNSLFSIFNLYYFFFALKNELHK